MLIRPKSVTDEPVFSIQNWKIFKITQEPVTYHFCGYHVDSALGRVCSPITEFNLQECTGITESGRKYILIGELGEHPDVRYVLGVWLYAQGVSLAEVEFISPEQLSTELSTKKEV